MAQSTKKRAATTSRSRSSAPSRNTGNGNGSRRGGTAAKAGKNGARGDNGGGALDSLRGAVADNPAAERLLGELQSYVSNRAQGLVSSLGDRITDTAQHLEDIGSGGGVGGGVGKELAKSGMKALGGGLKDKLGGLAGGNGSSGDGAKATIIEESMEIGVPVSVAYNQWTQFQEFGRFTKGVQSVDQKDEKTTNWRAKVAFSTRSWKATIREQVPDQRIAWTSEGDKGSVDGVITFHELAPNLTKVLLVMEYHSKGLFEKTGNLWRAQGRRARLDLKHFRRFVMMRGDETGSWRGRIEDGEVKKSSDDSSRNDRRRGAAKTSPRKRPSARKDKESESGSSRSTGRRTGTASPRSKSPSKSTSTSARRQGSSGARKSASSGESRSNARKATSRGTARKTSSRGTARKTSSRGGTTRRSR